MYRDKFRFAADAATVKLGDAEVPRRQGEGRRVLRQGRNLSQGSEDPDSGRSRGRPDPDAQGRPRRAAGITASATRRHRRPRRSSSSRHRRPPCPPLRASAAPAALVEPSPPASTPATASPPAPRATWRRRATTTRRRSPSCCSHGGFWLVIVSFFGFGLLLSLTPCVFPMVPILSGIIVSHGHAVTHGRAFVLSLAYVLGMAVTYAAVGVAAGFSGTLLSSALQNAWVLGGFALVFVAAVAVDVRLLRTATARRPAKPAVGHEPTGRAARCGAIAMMGALSALIVGPCVAAPLAGALLYIAQTGDAVLGGVGAVRHGAGHGRAAAGGRRLLPLAAAQGRPVDGSGEEVLRRAAAGHRACGWSRR